MERIMLATTKILTFLLCKWGTVAGRRSTGGLLATMWAKCGGPGDAAGRLCATTSGEEEIDALSDAESALLTTSMRFGELIGRSLLLSLAEAAEPPDSRPSRRLDEQRKPHTSLATTRVKYGVLANALGGAPTTMGDEHRRSELSFERAGGIC